MLCLRSQRISDRRQGWRKIHRSLAFGFCKSCLGTQSWFTYDAPSEGERWGLNCSSRDLAGTVGMGAQRLHLANWPLMKLLSHFHPLCPAGNTAILGDLIKRDTLAGGRVQGTLLTCTPFQVPSLQQFMLPLFMQTLPPSSPTSLFTKNQSLIPSTTGFCKGPIINGSYYFSWSLASAEQTLKGLFICASQTAALL